MPTTDDKGIFERGEFWLADQHGDATRHKTARGALTIGGDGEISLAIDAEDWKWGEPGETLGSLMARRFDVVGYLPRANQHVRFENGFVDRPQLTNSGCVAETIKAQLCLLSDSIAQGPQHSPCVTGLKVPLGPLSAWLGLALPQVIDAEAHFDVRYSKGFHEEFQFSDGKLIIEVETIRRHDWAKRNVTIERRAWVNVLPNSALSLTQARSLYFHLEDLLILLTDQEFSLDWPKIAVADGDFPGTLYATRRRPPPSEFSANECWIPFPEIIGIFGAIVDNWLRLRESYGPAFHLYLGTRRGVDLYEEHRFLNFMYGLEALHRRSEEQTSNPDLEAKIVRVLDSVDSGLASRDRKWLEKQLDRSREPSLAVRLQDILTKLPIGSPKASLTVFAERCAKLRNDISHFGGPRGGGGYDGFILEAHRVSNALDHLYHAAILQRIGIPDDILRRALTKSHKSFIVRTRLREVGLDLGDEPHQS